MVRRQPLPGLLYLHGLSVEMAEAFAEYVHKRIRGELGFAAEEARDHDESEPGAIAAARIRSATRPARTWPTSRLILELLRAEEIGVVLTEEDQLDPEHRPPPSSSTTRKPNTSV